MLAELKIELETDYEEFGYYQSSNMQGILMEKIESDYVEILHEQGLKPYSQHLEVGQKIYWVIHTLDEEAYRRIILPWLDPNIQEFMIKKKEIMVRIRHREVRIFRKQELLEEFYQKESERYLSLEFISPTAFKSKGNYVIFPDLRLIYQSLMNKYSAVCKDMELFDEELLEELVDNSQIVGYRLNSISFPMEGIKIPSFRGRIDIKLKGTETMARYIRFLAKFGEYSGVGIKTGMGMGALKIINRRKNNDR